LNKSPVSDILATIQIDLFDNKKSRLGSDEEETFLAVAAQTSQSRRSE